jgi:hypothetical protein
MRLIFFLLGLLLFFLFQFLLKFSQLLLRQTHPFSFRERFWIFFAFLELVFLLILWLFFSWFAFAYFFLHQDMVIKEIPKIIKNKAKGHLIDTEPSFTIYIRTDKTLLINLYYG